MSTDMAAQEDPRGRGRPPRAVAAQPSGYRMTANTRAEVDLIKAFFGFRSTQAVIDAAVTTFLQQQRQAHEGYRTAAEALDREAPRVGK